jgi:leucine dehydrogenase
MKLTAIPVEGYEQVVRCEDPHSGLHAFISVHDTTLGAALGGVRMWPYVSEQQAFTDVNRLAKSMTYKSAVAGLHLGGGKAVVMGDSRTDKSERLLRALGRFIDTFDGLYIAGEDVGTTVEDLCIVRQETRFVGGLPRGAGSSGNPAPLTALGVFLGMRACIERQLGSADFRGLRVAVQGCGNVARYLCQHLHSAGALLSLTDVQPDKAQALAQQYDAQLLAPEAIYEADCDIFAPCALGGVLNDDSIPRLRCQIVAGSANNQCLAEAHGDLLQQRGILYAPDFVINAGGVINIAVELAPEGYDEGRAVEKVHGIYHTLRHVFDMAAQERVPPHRAALRLAEQQLALGRQRKESVSTNGW